jgi:hypothetical protein
LPFPLENPVAVPAGTAAAVQENEGLAISAVKFIVENDAPEQIVCVRLVLVTNGFRFTVMVIVPEEAELPQLPFTVTVIAKTLKALSLIVGKASLAVVPFTNS